MGNHSFDFTGKIALVSGAATGIGKATALALGQAGATLVLADIDAERGEAVAAEIVQSGAAASFHRADLTSVQDVGTLFAAIEAQHGRLDIAHNNVGFGFAQGFLETTVEAWDKTLDLCLKSPFLCMQHEVRLMMRNGEAGGAIVNTASMAGVRYSWLADSAYSAAKAGLIHLTRYVAVRHAADKVRVNCVSPGLTATEAVAKFLDSDQQIEFAGKEQPIGRPIQPEEIAANVLWLLSDAAAMVTGDNICVAGGAQAA